MVKCPASKIWVYKKTIIERIVQNWLTVVWNWKRAFCNSMYPCAYTILFTVSPLTCSWQQVVVVPNTLFKSLLTRLNTTWSMRVYKYSYGYVDLKCYIPVPARVKMWCRQFSNRLLNHACTAWLPCQIEIWKLFFRENGSKASNQQMAGNWTHTVDLNLRNPCSLVKYSNQTVIWPLQVAYEACSMQCYILCYIIVYLYLSYK